MATIADTVRAYLARNLRVPYQERRDVTEKSGILSQPKAENLLTFSARILVDQDNQMVAQASPDGRTLQDASGRRFLTTADATEGTGTAAINGRSSLAIGDITKEITFDLPFDDNPLMGMPGVVKPNDAADNINVVGLTITATAFKVWFNGPIPESGYLLDWSAVAFTPSESTDDNGYLSPDGEQYVSPTGEVYVQP